MEELFKELENVGYFLVYLESFGVWKLVDASGDSRNFITSLFAYIVAKHGLFYSLGVLQGDGGLYVRFDVL